MAQELFNRFKLSMWIIIIHPTGADEEEEECRADNVSSQSQYLYLNHHDWVIYVIHTFAHYHRFNLC